MANPKLLTINGSLRKGSFNRLLLNEAVAAFGPAQVSDANIDMPLYHGDAESADGLPTEARTLVQQITEADAILIASPEYNKGISGVLKNALDWTSRTGGTPWKDKPVVVMSAAAGRTGGETAQFMTLHCLAQLQVRLILGPAILVPAAHEAFDDQGHLIEDSYKDLLAGRMQHLRAEIGA